MNQALEIFQRVPKTHNCAQSVAAGFGEEEKVAELQSCGAGRAPEGRCGALHAALLLTPVEHHETIRREFAAAAHSEFCRELKQVHHTPCEDCVRIASELVEKYRK